MDIAIQKITKWIIFYTVVRMTYNKEKYKEKVKERNKALRDSMKKLETSLFNDTEQIDRILESWRDNKYNYSFRNIMLASYQHEVRTKKPLGRIASYNGWKELGRQVKKGAKAIYILAPMIVKKENKEGEKEEYLQYFRSVPVFEYTDTEGKPLNFHKNSEISKTDINISEIVKNSKIKVKYDKIAQRGYTDGRKIVISDELDNNVKIAVYFHELIHSKLHFGEDRHQLDDKKKEFEAEAGAYLLCRYLGIENGDSKAYLKNWSTNKDSFKETNRVIKTVEKVIKEMKLEKLVV